MVINPRNSQKIMTWCVESVLGYLFDSIDSVKKKVSYKDMHDFLEEGYLDHQVSKTDVAKMVYDLKRRKYFDLDDGDSVKLTNKAKIKIIDKLVKTKLSDDKFRLVSFDIPESRRLSRDRFRNAIKRMGFVQIQKSLWAASINVGDLVEAAATEYKVSDYIAYFVVEKSNIDNHISNKLANK